MRFSRLLISAVYLIHVCEFVNARAPKWKARFKSWKARREEKRILKKKREYYANKARQARKRKPDESRWSSVPFMVNMTAASPTEYIRAELWSNGMKKFSNGEINFQTAVKNYRAALKRLGITPVKDGEQVEDRRGMEKNREILRILRESYE